MQQGGKTANIHGTQLEKLVTQIIEDMEYQFVEKNKFLVTSNCLEQKLYTKQIKICESIYSIDGNKHELHADFMLYNPYAKEKYIIFECKSQTSAGSIDEKYPYLNENIKEKYPHKTVVILDAPAAKKGAKLWLMEQMKLNHNLLSVFSDFSSFRTWALKYL